MIWSFKNIPKILKKKANIPKNIDIFYNLNHKMILQKYSKDISGFLLKRNNFFVITDVIAFILGIGVFIAGIVWVFMYLAKKYPSTSSGMLGKNNKENSEQQTANQQQNPQNEMNNLLQNISKEQSNENANKQQQQQQNNQQTPQNLPIANPNNTAQNLDVKPPEENNNQQGNLSTPVLNDNNQKIDNNNVNIPENTNQNFELPNASDFNKNNKPIFSNPKEIGKELKNLENISNSKQLTDL